MYPGPNRHPVDPRSVSNFIFALIIHQEREICRHSIMLTSLNLRELWLFAVLSGLGLLGWGITGASVLNRIETLCCVIIICLVIFTLLEWWSGLLNLVKPW